MLGAGGVFLSRRLLISLEVKCEFLDLIVFSGATAVIIAAIGLSCSVSSIGFFGFCFWIRPAGAKLTQ